ncbi:hypothetical protein TIFTF001_017671 [Ficus carica]|uniref:Uncharacterized protein n=1 Tax=Ficus carica TaxID=3494 RepID=A0AA88A2R6_FICCA|nr:hypothetical protein TIFTF001_017671 [Ficus carica]
MIISKQYKKFSKQKRHPTAVPQPTTPLHWQALQVAGHRCNDHHPYPHSAAAFRSISSPPRTREDPHRRITNSSGFSSSWVATHGCRGCKSLDPWLEGSLRTKGRGG